MPDVARPPTRPQPARARHRATAFVSMGVEFAYSTRSRERRHRLAASSVVSSQPYTVGSSPHSLTSPLGSTSVNVVRPRHRDDRLDAPTDIAERWRERLARIPWVVLCDDQLERGRRRPLVGGHLSISRAPGARAAPRGRSSVPCSVFASPGSTTTSNSCAAWPDSKAGGAASVAVSLSANRCAPPDASSAFQASRRRRPVVVGSSHRHATRPPSASRAQLPSSQASVWASKRSVASTGYTPASARCSPPRLRRRPTRHHRRRHTARAAPRTSAPPHWHLVRAPACCFVAVDPANLAAPRPSAIAGRTSRSRRTTRPACRPWHFSAR